MRLLVPRQGYRLAWSGDLPSEASTRRNLAPVLDALDEIEQHAPSLPRCPRWEPVTPELLDRVRIGLDHL